MITIRMITISRGRTAKILGRPAAEAGLPRVRIQELDQRKVIKAKIQQN